MIWVVLAAGFGIANFTLLALLFRRLRKHLNRQLSMMRAERNSEWILRALQAAPEQRAAQAANGRGYEPPPAGPEPVRRKKHLGLYLGGLAAVFTAIAQSAREAVRTHPVALGLAAASVATAATVVAVTPWQNDASRLPSSAPTATLTRGPSGSAPPNGSPTSTAPTGSRSARANSPSASVRTPATSSTVLPGPSSRVASPIVRTTRASSSRSGGPTGRPAPGPPGQGRSGATMTATPTPPPSATPTATHAPPAHGLCLRLDLDPVLRLRLCSTGGG